MGIDEIQRVPQLLIAIKKYVDEHKNPGDFVLTGSANIFSYPNTLDSLAGRMNMLTLSGFSLGEIQQTIGPINILQHLLSSNKPSYENIPKLNIWDHVFWGTFPDVFLNQDLEFRNLWYRAYITAYIERDLRDLAKDMTLFHHFFRYTGLLTGQIAVTNHYCNDLKMDHRTTNRYLDLLTMSYQIKKLEPFFSSHIKKTIKSPKIYMQDSGLAGWFFQFENQDSLIKSPHKGALLETFLFNELNKLCDEDPHLELSYFRTTDGYEIDFVVSKQSQHLLIECKSQLPSSSQSFRAIEHFRKTYPDAMGLVFYPGHEIKLIGPNIFAVPFGILAIRL